MVEKLIAVTLAVTVAVFYPSFSRGEDNRCSLNGEAVTIAGRGLWSSAPARRILCLEACRKAFKARADKKKAVCSLDAEVLSQDKAALGRPSDALSLSMAKFSAALFDGDTQNAAVYIEDIIKLDPGLCQAFAQRARVKDDAKDFKGALADFDKAIECDSQDGRAYKLRSRLRRHLLDFKGAQSDDERASTLLKPDFHVGCSVERDSWRDTYIVKRNWVPHGIFRPIYSAFMIAFRKDGSVCQCALRGNYAGTRRVVWKRIGRMKDDTTIEWQKFWPVGEAMPENQEKMPKGLLAEDFVTSIWEHGEFMAPLIVPESGCGGTQLIPEKEMTEDEICDCLGAEKLVAPIGKQ